MLSTSISHKENIYNRSSMNLSKLDEEISYTPPPGLSESYASSVLSPASVYTFDGPISQFNSSTNLQGLNDLDFDPTLLPGTTTPREGSIAPSFHFDILAEAAKRAEMSLLICDMENL